VSTDVGDVAQRLYGVSNSLICRSEKAMVESIIEVLQSDTRSNGREKVKEVSLTRCLERIREVYDRIIAEP
jgi:hypothetical protein